MNIGALPRVGEESALHNLNLNDRIVSFKAGPTTCGKESR
jgi:hypothetical protein